MDFRNKGIAGSLAELIEIDDDVALTLTSNVPASMRKLFYSTSVTFSVKSVISVCCCCKVGTKKDATECFQCVHSLVPIFDLCKMLCAGLGEHLLVELEARLKAMDTNMMEKP